MQSKKLTKSQSLKIHHEFITKLNERASAERSDTMQWHHLILTTPDNFLLEGELEVKRKLRKLH
jgi:hypothetical protein